MTAAGIVAGASAPASLAAARKPRAGDSQRQGG